MGNSRKQALIISGRLLGYLTELHVERLNFMISTQPLQLIWQVNAETTYIFRLDSHHYLEKREQSKSPNLYSGNCSTCSPVTLIEIS